MKDKIDDTKVNCFTIDEDTWKQIAQWLRRLSWIISNNFDGSKEQRNTYEELQLFLAMLEARGLPLP